MADNKENGTTILIGIVTLVPLTVLGAWSFMWWWAWFVLPVFPAAPTLSLIDSVGLLFVARYLAGAFGRKDDRTIVEGIVHALSTLAILWLFAVIVHGLQ